MKKSKKWWLPLVLVGLYACHVGTNMSNNEIPGEILIDFQTKYNPTNIESDFTRYELKRQNTISPTLNIVRFTFNPDKISVGRLVKKVIKHEGVEGAQSNKKTTKRG